MTSPAVAGAGPLQSVMGALRAGAGTVDEVAGRAGLDRDLVDMAVAYLVRSGRVAALPLAGSCSGGSCGTCVLGAAGGPCGPGRAVPGSGPAGAAVPARGG